MGLTVAEIVELEGLEKDKKLRKLKALLANNALKSPHPSKNYRLLQSCIKRQKWGIDKTGKPALLDGYAGAVLEGSSRSTKTWGGIDIIIWLATILHKSEAITINIYRETYNEFKTTLYDDFKRRLNDFELDNPFERVKEVASFKIDKATVHFLGDGKHGGGCDYAFFNEAMTIDRKVFDQVEMRCRKFWWMDYNPSVTDHWVFDNVVPRDDVAFLRTTFKDNPFISPNELNKILGYEPWLPGSYTVTEDNIYYQGEPVTEKNQPPPHPTNTGVTADLFNWKVYGLGLRGAMEGVIYQNVNYIEKWPEDMDHIYVNDFGFTADPNATIKYMEDEDNIWFEPLLYKPIETAPDLAENFELVGVDPDKLIVCDSSDKHVSETKGVVKMVEDLIDNGYPNAVKVSKTKSVIFWVLSVKKKKIHCVSNHLVKKVKKEQENYVFRKIHGIQVNQPIDKYNHIWDAVRYGHMEFNNGYSVYW